ncbi:precorrin-6A reductase [Tissierella pigra]|uniref:Precorrin-6A reductase n=1 Tax=Tissierella pigra TaxID=2607614 RepID=A0A6N7XIS9_9FIRM|nr:precorrin-6A reductase [Tissierella pigra]MBU5425975.1 precorrin-6A reductase [Tissierella pigra]MSU00662.1 precorrin-6A reductase [Tissierella pigra]
MIWIIGGTSEAREIVNRIKDIDNYIVTMATDGGKEFLHSNKILIGRMNYEEMIEFSKKNKISLIVDLTHPYARIVSENAKKVANTLEIDYIRYIRDKVDVENNIIYLQSYEEAYEYISKISGTVFFTTGSKNIGDFEKIRGNNRFIYRILPALESIEECKKYNVQMKDIVAVLGPFSKEYNKVMFEEYNPKYCVMKDSGHRGGTLEKIKACKELDITPIVIGRGYENGIRDLNIIENIIREKNNKKGEI